jgi:hypothetical protein
MARLAEPKVERRNTINDSENNRGPFSLTESDEQTEAQALAAKRSLITNLVLIGQFLLTDMAMPFIAKEYLLFYVALIFPTLKGALPILTTIANFGTVANVISLYWAYLKHKLNRA